MKRMMILLAVLLAGCSFSQLCESYDPTFDTIPTMGFTTPEEVGQWNHENITWTDDPSGYFQSPEETYGSLTGDCEDYVALMMYFVHKELGGFPIMVCGIVGEGTTANHVWMEYDGRWYESEYGTDVTDNPYYHETFSLEYGEAMLRSVTVHRSIEIGPEKMCLQFMDGGVL